MSESSRADPNPDGLQSVGFGEIRLQPGSRVQLVLTRQGGEQSHFTTVVGFVRDEYLILKSPVRRQAPIPIEVDEPLRVRLFSGIHLYEFRCSVLRVLSAGRLHPCVLPRRHPGHPGPDGPAGTRRAAGAAGAGRRQPP